MRVGAVLSIEEGEGAVPMPRPIAMAARAEAVGVPIEAGEIELRASVRVVFAIELGTSSFETPRLRASRYGGLLRMR